MKTVLDVVNYSMTLLGYTDMAGTPDAEQYASVYKSAIVFANTIISDLARIEGKFPIPVTSVQDEIGLSQQSIDDIVPYGLCWLIAQSESDGAKEAFYGAMYQQKRGSAPAVKKFIKNVYKTR